MREQSLKLLINLKILVSRLQQGAHFMKHKKGSAGKALKANFKMNKYLYLFTDISITHKLEFFVMGPMFWDLYKHQQ